jgi:hypothetical protein
MSAARLQGAAGLPVSTIPAASDPRIVFLAFVRRPGLLDEPRLRPARRARRPATQSRRSPVAIALRLVLFAPAAACLIVAWLLATGLALLWAAMAGPLRRGGGTTAD